MRNAMPLVAICLFCLFLTAPAYEPAPSVDEAALIEESEAWLPGAPGLSINPDWLVISTYSGSRFGATVAGLGDVDNDGFGDVAVAAPEYTNGHASEGAVFVYYGTDLGPATTADWHYEPNRAGEACGTSLAAGNLNGDAYDDLIIGAPLAQPTATTQGAVYVFYGSAAGLPAAPSVTLTGNEYSGRFGESVAVGDVDQDGWDDLLIGDPYYSEGQMNEGKIHLFFGSAAGPITPATWSYRSNNADAWLGLSVAIVGDLDLDGFADLAAGAPGMANGQIEEGLVLVFYGAASTPAAAPDMILESNLSYNHFGLTVSPAGDVDGDGYADLAVGSYEIGTAQVYRGSYQGVVTTPVWSAESDQVEAEFGYRVAGLGDVDGDAFEDLIVSAPGLWEEGWVFVFHGSQNGLPAVAEWSVQSAQMNAGLGRGAAGAGDVNGDGYSDVIIGADHFSNAKADEGAAFIYFGACKGCEIGGVCYLPDDINPENGCQICAPDLALDAWSPYNMDGNGDPVSCDDSIFCNGPDVCLDGSCSTHSGDPCQGDGIFCNGVESCNETTDLCEHSGNPCPDDNLWCNGDELCDEGGARCLQVNVPRCPDDEQWCNGLEQCDEDNNECTRINVPDCSDDGIFCNGVESCDEGNDRCLNVNVPDCSDDGVWCNGDEFCDEEADQCDSTFAEATNPRCPDDGAYCNGEEFCNENEDQCGAANVPPCEDDGDWCNGAESCNEDLDRCDHEYMNETNPRCPDDGAYCNGEEMCDEEEDQCVSTGDPCADDDTACNEKTDTCDDPGDDDDDDDVSPADDDDDNDDTGGPGPDDDDDIEPDDDDAEHPGVRGGDDDDSGACGC